VTETGRLRVGVLASGSGTNLQALLDTVHGVEVEIVAVGSDQPAARALDRARERGVVTRSFPRDAYADRAARDEAMARWLEACGVELVVLAGYMQLLTLGFLGHFPNRVINVHPSLLPAFPGPQPIEDTVAAGATFSGVTVHVVDEGIDTGPILAQEEVEIAGLATRDEVHERLRPIEHRLLPEVVRRFARGDLG
jgi:phosphoribosylglycinamide formyltransferase-1